MSKLTRRSLDLMEGFESDASHRQLTQKLGELEHRGVDLVEQTCDNVCRFVDGADPEEMDSICAGCSLAPICRAQAENAGSIPAIPSSSMKVWCCKDYLLRFS